MKNIFLSFSFRDADRELVAQVEQLLASHNIAVVTGRRLGGGQLTPEVMQRIAAPMVGGMITAPLLSLFVIPAVYLLWKQRELD